MEGIRYGAVFWFLLCCVVSCRVMSCRVVGSGSEGSDPGGLPQRPTGTHIILCIHFHQGLCVLTIQGPAYNNGVLSIAMLLRYTTNNVCIHVYI